MADKDPPNDVLSASGFVKPRNGDVTAIRGDAKRFKATTAATEPGQTAEPGKKESSELKFWRDDAQAVGGAKFDASIFSKDLDEDDLVKHKDWIRAARLVHDLYEGEDKTAQLTDEEVAKWGVSQMRWVNTNTASIGNAGVKLLGGSANADQKVAFMYMMDAFDHKSATGWGVAAGLGSAIVDPANLVGIGVGGVAAKVAARAAFTTGLKKVITSEIGKKAITFTVGAGVESTLQTTLDQKTKQGVAIDTGRQVGGWDWGKYATNLTINTAANITLGAGLPVVAKYVGKKWDNFIVGDAHLATVPNHVRLRMKKADRETVDLLTNVINKTMQRGGAMSAGRIDRLVAASGLDPASTAVKKLKESAEGLEKKAQLFVGTEQGSTVSISDARRFVSTPLAKLMDADDFKAGQTIKREANTSYKPETRVMHYDTDGSALINKSQARLLANLHYSSAHAYKAWRSALTFFGKEIKISNVANRLPRMFVEERFIRPLIRSVDTAINEAGLIPEARKLELGIEKIASDLAAPGDLAAKKVVAEIDIRKAFKELADRNKDGLTQLEAAATVRLKELQAIGYQKKITHAGGKEEIVHVRRDPSSESGPDRISKLPGQELMDQKQYEAMEKYLKDLHEMATSLRAGDSPANIHLQQFLAKIESATDTGNDLAVGATNRIGRLGSQVRMRLANLYKGEEFDLIDRDGTVIEAAISHNKLASHIVYKQEMNIANGYYGRATDWEPIKPSDLNAENEFSSFIHYVENNVKKDANGNLDWLPGAQNAFFDRVEYYVKNNMTAHAIAGLEIIQMGQGVKGTAPLRDSSLISRMESAKNSAPPAMKERWDAVIRQANWTPEEAYLHGERDVLKNFRIAGLSLIDWKYFKASSMISAGADSKWGMGAFIPMPAPGAPGQIMVKTQQSKLTAHALAFLTGGEVTPTVKKGKNNEIINLYTSMKGNGFGGWRPDALNGKTDAEKAAGVKALERLNLPNTPENNTWLARAPRWFKILDNASGGGLPVFLGTGGLVVRDSGKRFGYNVNAHAWWHLYAPSLALGVTGASAQSLFNDPSKSDFDNFKWHANWITEPARAMTHAYPYAIAATPYVAGGILDLGTWGVTKIKYRAEDGNFDRPGARRPELWQAADTIGRYGSIAAEKYRDFITLELSKDDSYISRATDNLKLPGSIPNITTMSQARALSEGGVFITIDEQKKETGRETVKGLTPVAAEVLKQTRIDFTALQALSTETLQAKIAAEQDATKKAELLRLKEQVDTLFIGVEKKRLADITALQQYVEKLKAEIATGKDPEVAAETFRAMRNAVVKMEVERMRMAEEHKKIEAQIVAGKPFDLAPAEQQKRSKLADIATALIPIGGAHAATTDPKADIKPEGQPAVTTTAAAPPPPQKTAAGNLGITGPLEIADMAGAIALSRGPNGHVETADKLFRDNMALIAQLKGFSDRLTQDIRATTEGTEKQNLTALRTQLDNTLVGIVPNRDRPGLELGQRLEFELRNKIKEHDAALSTLTDNDGPTALRHLNGQRAKLIAMEEHRLQLEQLVAKFGKQIGQGKLDEPTAAEKAEEEKRKQAATAAINDPKTLEDCHRAAAALAQTGDAVFKSAIGDIEALNSLKAQIATRAKDTDDATKKKHLEKLLADLTTALEKINAKSDDIQQLQEKFEKNNKDLQDLLAKVTDVTKTDELATAQRLIKEQEAILKTMRADSDKLAAQKTAFTAAFVNSTDYVEPIVAPAAAGTTAGGKPGAASTTKPPAAPARVMTPEETRLNDMLNPKSGTGKDYIGIVTAAIEHGTSAQPSLNAIYDETKALVAKIKAVHAAGNVTVATQEILDQAILQETAAATALKVATEAKAELIRLKGTLPAAPALTGTPADIQKAVLETLAKAEPISKAMTEQAQLVFNGTTASAVTQANKAHATIKGLMDANPEIKLTAADIENQELLRRIATNGSGSESQRTLLNKTIAGAHGAPSLIERGANVISDSFTALSNWDDKMAHAMRKKGSNHETAYQIGKFGLIAIAGMAVYTNLKTLWQSATEGKIDWMKWLVLGGIAAFAFNRDGKRADEFDLAEGRNRQADVNRSLVGQTGAAAGVAPHANSNATGTATVTGKDGKPLTVPMPETAGAPIQTANGEAPRANNVIDLEERRLAAQQGGRHGSSVSSGQADVVAHMSPIGNAVDARHVVIRDGLLPANDFTAHGAKYG